MKKIVYERVEEDPLTVTRENLALKVEAKGLKKPTRDEVTKVLKEDLNMVFRRIRMTSVLTNSVLTKILRQKFALRFMSLITEGYVIINLDECTFNKCNFKRYAW